MTKFKKGDVVIKMAPWNSNGVWYWQKFIVESWGEKSATVRKVSDDKMSKDRVYPQAINKYVHGQHFFLEGSVDIDAMGIELAKADQAQTLKDLEKRIETWGNDSAAYKENIEGKIEVLKATKARIENILILSHENRHPA